MDSTEKMRRIGFFGGSFNPPTVAHKALADFAFDALSLDLLLWVVAPHNPEKDPATLAPFNHRYQMVKKYIEDRPAMQASDIEEKNNSSWTIDTVRNLRAMYPNDALYFIIGTDNWLGFHLWGRDYEQILENVSIVILERPEYEQAAHAAASGIFADMRADDPSALKPYGTWCILQNPQFNVAATHIRKALQNGEEPPHLHDDIHDYIKENRLYQKII